VVQFLLNGLVQSGETRDAGRKTKKEKFVRNVNPLTGGSLNRGFYMESTFKRNFVLNARVFTVG